MRSLQQRVGFCHLRTWFAQTKTQLAEQSLTLAHLQLHPQVSLQERGQSRAVPHLRRQPIPFRAVPQRCFDLGHLLVVQPTGTPGTLTFRQPSQSLSFKTPHPVYDAVVGIAQQLRNQGARHALRSAQYAVESVIIA